MFLIPFKPQSLISIRGIGIFDSTNIAITFTTNLKNHGREFVKLINQWRIKIGHSRTLTQYLGHMCIEREIGRNGPTGIRRTGGNFGLFPRN